MQPTVTITIAKNGYFVRYVVTERNRQTNPELASMGIESPQHPFMPAFREESMVTTDEMEIIALLKSLRGV